MTTIAFEVTFEQLLSLLIDNHINSIFHFHIALLTKILYVFDMIVI